MKPLFKFIIISITLNLLSFSLVNGQETNNTFNEQIIDAAQNYVATYFGGSGSEFCEAIVLDDAGNVFIAGYTTSVNFPTTAGSYNTTPKGKNDIFIMKFDKDLKTVLASTLIGGVEDEYAYSILYDKRGYIYMSGDTDSKDFPTTSSAYRTEYRGGEGDSFILKMDKDLTTLISSTLFGGSGSGIVQDDEGNIYIAGSTSSADFPTTHGAFREKYNGGPNDVFVSKFDPELKRLLASTFIGGSHSDRMGSLCMDSENDEICIGGYTYSFDFPVSKDAYGKEGSAYTTGFVSKLTMDLTEMTASTLLYGVWVYSMMVHEDGDIYVGGHAENRLPTSSNAYYRTFDKCRDQGYISRLSNDLSKLKSSTVLPGSRFPREGTIVCLNLSQSPDGDIISAGWAGSKDFPSTPGAFDETQNGATDIYILKMNKDLSRLLVSTFIGSSEAERWNHMTADKNGNIYLASNTPSSDFPTTNGSAFEKFTGGENDGFIIRLDNNLLAEVFEEFHDAAKKDDLKKVKKLLSQNSKLLEKIDKYKRTALHSAARYGAVSVSKYLMEKGASLNAVDESENTPLHLASMYGFDEVVKLLVNLNVDINAVNKDHESPLFLAVLYGTPKTVRMLLSKNADRNIRDKESNTLLHIASLFGRVKKVQEILKYKPEVDSRNKAGKTPLHLAVNSYSDDQHVIEFLLDHGADLSATDNTGRSVLHFASTLSTKTLIKRGANINFQDRDGNTPLHSILITFLKDKTFFSFNFSFNKDKIKILMEKGADSNIKNKNGKSPMDLAIELGEKKVMDLLKAKK